MAYTTESVKNFLSKNKITPDIIRYILRRHDETEFYLLDSRVVKSLIPLGHFQAYLPDEDFVRINKSVLVCAKQVVNVNKGIYLMTDGVSLEGRHHGTGLHTDFMRRMIERQSDQDEGMNQKLLQKFKAFDDLPIPFCVIQLVFDVYGKSTSFIFRYCNNIMSELEGKPINMILNHSFYDIFENPDEKWLVLYGDIAKNGGKKIFRGYKKKLGKYLNIICYQVAPGYCGCLIMTEDWESQIGDIYVEKTDGIC